MFPAVAVVIAFAALPDPLPTDATCRLGAVRFRGPCAEGLTFSPDGKMPLAPTAPGAHVWDAATGRRLPDILCPPANTTATQFHSVIAGGRVVRLSHEKNREDELVSVLYVGDLGTGKQLCREELKEDWLTFPDHIHPYTRLNVSAGGSRVAYYDRIDRRVRLFDTATGKTAPVADEYGTLVELSPDGDTLATLTYEKDGRLQVWDVATGKKRAEMSTVKNTILFRVSDGGKWLVARTGTRASALWPEYALGEPAHPLQVWDGTTGEKVGQLEPYAATAAVRFVGLDAVLLYGARIILDGTEVGVLSRWNLKTMKKEWETEYTTPEWVQPDLSPGAGPPRRLLRTPSLAVSADGKRCAVGDGKHGIALFDATTGDRLDATGAHDGPVQAVAFSPDGKAVHTVGDTDVRTWDAATGGLKSTAADPVFLRGRAATGIVNGVVVWTLRMEKKGEVEVLGWDVAKRKVVWRFNPEFKPVDRVLTHDGKTVMLVGGVKSGEWTFGVYDGPTGKCTDEWKGQHKDVGFTHPVLTPDGKRVWMEGWRSNQVWDSRQFHVPADEQHAIYGFRPTDGGADSEVPVPVWTAMDPDGRPFWSMAAAPEGKSVATVGYAGGVFVTVIGREATTRRFTEVKEKAGAVFFSPDGKLLAALDRTSSKIWVYDLDGKDDQTPQTFDGGETKGTAAAFSPDGKRLAVGYADGTAVVWKLK